MRRRVKALASLCGLGIMLSNLACTSANQGETYATATITPEGGEYRLGAVTVTAPPGAVSRSAKLTISKPRPVNEAAQAPFRTRRVAGVAFDVALDGTQPQRALTAAFTLNAEFLPSGAKAENALAYSSTPSGDTSFHLVPSRIEKSGSATILIVTLNRLSPKWIVFPDLTEIASAIFGAVIPTGLYRSRPADCQREATLNGVAVQLATSVNWSDGALSPVHPCVEVQDNQLRLKILNNSLVYYQVATTSGAAPQFERTDINADIIKQVATKLFPNSIIKGYLGRSEQMFVVATTSQTTRVELRTTPDTFLAEASWIAANFAAEVWGGDASKVKQVFDSIDVVSCLQSLVKTQTARMWQIGSAGSSKRH